MSKQSGYDMITGEMLSTHQLLTKREKDRKFPTLKDSVFMEVNLPKENTFWFKGARFPKDYNFS